MVRLKSTEKRLFLSDRDKKERKNKLMQLTKEFGLPEYVGELFLNELKLSKNPKDTQAIRKAKLLGLIEGTL